MATAVVKGPSNEYFLHFEDACDAYVSRIFPDWKLIDKTFMFPPCFPCRYLAPTGQASGAVPLTKSEEVDLKGDIAELKIFRALDKFGRESKQPMFVFTKFEFKDFTERVLSQRLPEDFIQSHFANLSTTDLTREIDFLVIHKHVGIILIEVKATEKFKKNRYLDAKKQLQIGEQFIQTFLHTTGISIPLFKVVALPNVTEHGPKSAEYIDLRSDDLGRDDSGEAFEHWWRQHFIEKYFSKEEEGELLRLTALFVGQRTAISATANILGRVFRTIDEQSFLEKSYDKHTKKGRPADVASAVVKLHEAPKLAILAKQFVFLNPEQLNIWEGPTRQIFCGAPGSGKTILLQHKALECAKKQEKVVVFVPPILDKLYIEFFTQNEVNVLVVDYTELTNFIAVDEKNTITLHIFIDEFQILLNTNQVLVDSLKRFLAKHASSEHYQWIAYDVNQLPLGNETFGIPRSHVSSYGYLSMLCKEQSFIHAPSLTTVMRCTSEVYEFLQRYLQFSFGKQTPESDDIRKHWHHAVHLGHHVSGPEVIVEGKITYTSREARFLDCSDIILDQITEWAKEDDKHYYSKLAVLVAAQKWIDELSPYLERKGIPVCRIGSSENAVVVDYADYARSYEWPVVISVCGHLKSMQNYIPVSRAVTRLLVLWWK